MRFGLMGNLDASAYFHCLITQHLGLPLAKLHLSATNIAARLKAVTKAPKSIKKIDPDKGIQWVQKQMDITLAPNRWKL